MTINQMFAAAVMSKSTHPGYMVYADRGNGIEEIGPYSKEIALDVAKDLHGDVMDLETGEIL